MTRCAFCTEEILPSAQRCRNCRRGIADASIEETHERFWSRVEKTASCWIWRGTVRGEYGRFKIRGVYFTAHRLSYEWLVGPIPEGLTLDHVRARGCSSTLCVNPAHLEPVTMKENLARGESPSARATRATHCPKNHPYSGKNLIVSKSGFRRCRSCKREAARRRRRADQTEPGLSSRRAPEARSRGSQTWRQS